MAYGIWNDIWTFSNYFGFWVRLAVATNGQSIYVCDINVQNLLQYFDTHAVKMSHNICLSI